jgi:hypothetical protein
VSIVDEYIGGVLGHYAIQFQPAPLGTIKARVGFANVPFNFGTLEHRVENEEMLSRFHIKGLAFVKPRDENGRALLVHCAEEMAHLASFLPRLFRDSAVRG